MHVAVNGFRIVSGNFVFASLLQLDQEVLKGQTGNHHIDVDATVVFRRWTELLRSVKAGEFYAFLDILEYLIDVSLVAWSADTYLDG